MTSWNQEEICPYSVLLQNQVHNVGFITFSKAFGIDLWPAGWTYWPLLL